jgi:lysylphosphatidylglycerol synthetase-like protein (DUF2156 family)
MKPITFPTGLGGLIAVCVLVLVIVFAVLHQLPVLIAVLLGLLAIAILLP